MEQKLKQIEDNKIIGAGGEEYLIHSSLTINRFKKLEELQIQISFDKSPLGLFNQWLDVHKLINEGRIADIAVLAKDNMDALAGIVNRTELGLRITALFINTENEDLNESSDEFLDKKIEDWLEAGYDAISFFQFATNLQKDLIKLSESVSLDISETRKMIEKIEKKRKS